jgi:hypothetical protein
MSKQLDFEYKKFHNENLPDLWERIEAGLTEKPQTEEDRKITKNSRNYHRILRYGGLAAAVFVTFIGVSFFLRNVGMKSAMDASVGNREEAMMTESVEETAQAPEIALETTTTESAEDVLEEEFVTEEVSRVQEAFVTLISLDTESYIIEVLFEEYTSGIDSYEHVKGDVITLSMTKEVFEQYESQLQTVGYEKFLLGFSKLNEESAYQAEWIEFDF